jgi:hypothetical protein
MKKFINHQIKKCLLFRCRHAIVIMQTLNWTNHCPLFMTVRHIFEISEDDQPPNTPTSLVTNARDNWWTLDFANAFVSPGVNSRGELVPSHGASRRRLGDYFSQFICTTNIVSAFFPFSCTRGVVGRCSGIPLVLFLRTIPRRFSFLRELLKTIPSRCGWNSSFDVENHSPNQLYLC